MDSSSNTGLTDDLNSRVMMRFPLDILYCLSEFVNINNLLLASRSFIEHKKALYSWHLSWRCTRSFLSNIGHRSKLLSRMNNPRRQLYLKLSAKDYAFSLLDGFPECHSLDLSDCQGISDVNMLGNVHSLNLNYCRGISDVGIF